MTWVAVVMWLQRAWAWIRANSTAVLLCVIGCFTGAALLRRKDSQINSLKDAVAANKHAVALKRLETEREQLLKQDQASRAIDEQLLAQQRELEARIAAKKRELLALHDHLDPYQMSEEELEARFRRAGL